MKTEKDHRKDPFQAPDGYFDHLADRIERRIDMLENDSRRGTVLSMRSLGWAAAAVIILLTVFWVTTRDGTREPSAEELVAQLTDEEIIEYLATSDMTVEELMETAAFDEADLDSLEWQLMPEFDLTPGEAEELIDLYEMEELENS